MWGSGLKEVRTKNGLRIIKITEKKQFRGKPREVLLLLLKLLIKFYVHNANIVNQYECTTKLKREPESNSVVIHMDFSENYSIKYNTEIHTSVIYLSSSSTPISFCTYSDSVRHDAAAVWGHIIPILRYIEKTAPETESLHFMTDSTCSQYRNKTINYIITKLHWYLPKLKTVTWNYSEAGHGKGGTRWRRGYLKKDG
ncbi:unnamed protein product [Parnassius apollo]|uniref:(apollo) hypothetical protein n=1 Tax=Parnassius apollo TaxID=110799 RepID=A0A8S3X208_PARAO|nr:unnamed protein product [Parnassius apollo]